MAFALLLIGLVMIVSAVRNTQDTLVCLIKSDFTGDRNFLYWVVALLVIGSIGYVDRLKPFSDALLVLIILAVFLAAGKPGGAGGGFFQQFSKAISQLGTGTGTGQNLVQVGRNLLGGGIGPL